MKSTALVRIGQVIGEMVFPFESSAADGAAELRLDSALESHMLVQGIAFGVRLVAVAAAEQLPDKRLQYRPT